MTAGISAGITVDGREVRIDLDVARKAHDVNEDDPNCRTCGVEYPCTLAEIVEQLDDWLHAQPKTPAPDGAAEQEDGTC